MKVLAVVFVAAAGVVGFGAVAVVAVASWIGHAVGQAVGWDDVVDEAEGMNGGG